MLGPDVDLVAPVADTVGVLHPEPRVATEVRCVGVDDRQPVGLGLGEEVVGHAHHGVLGVGIDAVTDEVAEARSVQCVAQLTHELLARCGVGTGEEACDVEHGQGGHRHDRRSDPHGDVPRYPGVAFRFMALVESNGITIEYHEQGSGEPLLLVMGLGGQLIDWPQGLVDEFVERGFRVISYDNRDSGLSTEFTSVPPTKGELAKAVMLRRRAALRVPARATWPTMRSGCSTRSASSSAHVVGMSMGGMIAQMIAIEHPDRVRSLTSIMSTTGPYVGRPKWAVIRKMVRRQIPTPETAVDQSIEAFRDVCGPTFDADEFRQLAQRSVERSFRPNGTSRQLAAIIASPDRTAGLQQLRMPALVIHGMVDPLVQPSGGYATARAIPGARLVMFNDMGHDLPRTRWAEIADEVAALAARAPQPVGV